MPSSACLSFGSSSTRRRQWAVVITAVLPVFINVAVVWGSWRDADRRMVLALLLPALAGVVVGVEVLRVVDPEYIRLAVSLS